MCVWAIRATKAALEGAAICLFHPLAAQIDSDFSTTALSFSAGGRKLWKKKKKRERNRKTRPECSRGVIVVVDIVRDASHLRPDVAFCRGPLISGKHPRRRALASFSSTRRYTSNRWLPRCLFCSLISRRLEAKSRDALSVAWFLSHVSTICLAATQGIFRFVAL